MNIMKVLIVVDMQKDFIDGTLGTPEAVAIVDNVVKRIESSKDELILFTQDTHQEDYLNTSEGKKLPIPHCIENTPGWQINESVLCAWRSNSNTINMPELQDNIFTKPVFGSIKMLTFLESRKADITEIEILGLCTDICVLSNAIMIKNFMPDIKIMVNSACCAGVTPQSHSEALNIMKMCHIDVIAK